MITFKFLSGKEIKWVTKRGKKYKISNMSTAHILNVINCLNGLGYLTIPNPYKGRTKDEWRQIFNQELRRRNEIF